MTWVRVDAWFAWYPVRLGVHGTGQWAWMRRVWRCRCQSIAVYQELEKIDGT
jgi:hypothetical protein